MSSEINTVLATLFYLCKSSRPDISKYISSQTKSKLSSDEIILSSVLLYLRTDSVVVSVKSNADDLTLFTRSIHHPKNGHLPFELLGVPSLGTLMQIQFKDFANQFCNSSDKMNPLPIVSLDPKIFWTGVSRNNKDWFMPPCPHLQPCDGTFQTATSHYKQRHWEV